MRFKLKHSHMASKSTNSKIKQPVKPVGLKPFVPSSANIAPIKSKASKHVRVVTPADYSQLTNKSDWAAKHSKAMSLTSNKPVVVASKQSSTVTIPPSASNTDTNHTAATPSAINKSPADIWADRFMHQCVPPFPLCMKSAAEIPVARVPIASRVGVGSTSIKLAKETTLLPSNLLSKELPQLIVLLILSGILPEAEKAIREEA